MSKLRIESSNVNNAKIFIDDFEIPLVKSVNLTMVAGEKCFVTIKAYINEGVELDVEPAKVTIVTEVKEK